MKQVKNTLEFNAQMLADLMERENIRIGSLATTLKDTRGVEAFCRSLCEKMTEAGKPTSLCKVGEEPEGEGRFLVTAFHPQEDMDSFRACLESDGVILVERYGITRHKDLEDVSELLRGHGARILGVLSLKD